MRIVIADAHKSGWANGGYIVGRILHGDLAGEYLFVAEGVKPVVRVGQVVRGGARVADRVNSPFNGIFGNIETGFAAVRYPGMPLAEALRGFRGDQSTAAITAGCAMNRLIGDLRGARGHLASGLRPVWSLLPRKIRRQVGLA